MYQSRSAPGLTTQLTSTITRPSQSQATDITLSSYDIRLSHSRDVKPPHVSTLLPPLSKPCDKHGRSSPEKQPSLPGFISASKLLIGPNDVQNYDSCHMENLLQKKATEAFNTKTSTLTDVKR